MNRVPRGGGRSRAASRSPAARSPSPVPWRNLAKDLGNEPRRHHMEASRDRPGFAAFPGGIMKVALIGSRWFGAQVLQLLRDRGDDVTVVAP
ncbi:MAG: hypothetical protein M3248_03870, partial [Actinomycetota bacterium]|nr:hypothetical protein [Actinomycetota bacterium]